MRLEDADQWLDRPDAPPSKTVLDVLQTLRLLAEISFVVYPPRIEMECADWPGSQDYETVSRWMDHVSTYSEATIRTGPIRKGFMELFESCSLYRPSVEGEATKEP